MNTITVTAHGAPNSLARKLQHDPTLGIEAIKYLRRIVELAEGERGVGDDSPLCLGAIALLKLIDAEM